MTERHEAMLLSDENRARIHAILETLATHDRAIEARTYARFLSDPGVKDLFGPSLANRRQMFDDTLIAIHDLCDDASWLRENLLALGSRHRHTYEVTLPMYDAWRDAVVDGTRDVVGAELDDATAAALGQAIDLIHRLMLVGAYPKGMPKSAA